MIILCADDFGLAQGVNRGIAELCQVGRLSATSALVTLPRWQDDAQRLGALRATAAIGLHLNLTLGRPIVSAREAPHLTADGEFLPVRHLAQRAIVWSLKGGAMQRELEFDALRKECRAQIDAFQSEVGALPDFIDGHQHVHGIPVIRDALIAAMAEFDWAEPPLVRVPSDAGLWLGRRPGEWIKRGGVAEMTRGLRNKLRKAGFPINDKFGGFSSFKIGSDYRAELAAAFARGAGHCHLVMCHPGYVDDELAASGDPVVERRAEELQGIMAFDGLSDQIWHPSREPDGAIDWMKAMSA